MGISPLRMWLIAGVETDLDWPKQETSVDLLGRSFVLRPPTSEAAADIRTSSSYPDEQQVAYEGISRFLSVFSWWWGRGARIGLCTGSTAERMRIGNRGLYPPPLTEDFYIPTEMPIPKCDQSRLAVALYREALTVRNTSYGFLGFLKILNINCPKPQEQIEWINVAIANVNEPDAQKRLSELTATEPNIGSYLYGSGRCAVAHASASPTVDPDGGSDLLRLQMDLPVARALAEYRIQEKFHMDNWYSALVKRRKKEGLRTAS
jgi:Methylamine utilization protein MauJ